jgi:hypothetical protein
MPNKLTALRYIGAKMYENSKQQLATTESQAVGRPLHQNQKRF